MNHNGAENILLLHFYGLTLIYLTGPLSQVVQLKCDIYIYIYIYIYKEMCERERDIYPIFLPFGSTPHFGLDRILGEKGRAH